ncbi:MAG: hypothetical protein JOZ16_14810 [Methylobacteriaceae bacterium]|nr:hypothetical protein [Methylobacteriaceae bacterium]
MNILKIMVLGATMSGALALPAFACTQEMVSINNDFGYVRGTPDRSGEQLWKLAAGATVEWCGRNSTDGENITWHWVSFRSQEEPWEHKGWMSSRILEPQMATGRSVGVGRSPNSVIRGILHN